MAIDRFGRISRRRRRRCVSKVLSMSSQNSPSSSETSLMGFIDANVHRDQWYDITLRGREIVDLVRVGIREINAFSAANVKKIGFVDRRVSKVLSPLIDTNLIAIEGVLPWNCGRKDLFKAHCQIHVYARVDKFEEAKSAIADGRLTLNSDLSKVVVVENKKKWEVIDEIFGLGNKRGALQELEPPKDVIKSELFVHQKEGLGWLVHRENSCELPPFWDMKNGGYENVLTNCHTNVRPEPLPGGIFADDIGMGKTLTLLSLIAFDKCESVLPSLVSENVENAIELGEEDEGLSFSGGKRKHRIWGRKSKTSTGSQKRRKDEYILLDIKVKGTSNDISVGLGRLDNKSTLIVCPPSVFSTWKTQIGEHTSPGKLKVYMYHGERTENPDHLKSHDIVLTTYSTLASERSREDSPVKKIKWWRVILDEAHVIKNADAQQSLAVTELNANRRWVVTGKPIHNGSLNLYSFMAFLHFEPFSIKSDWQRLVQRPLNVRDRAGFSRLQVLMAAISLRRTKDKCLIVLPPKTVEICYVELSKEEREFYDQTERNVKSFIWQYMSRGFLMRNYSAILGTSILLRQICNDMSLCRSKIRSLFPSDNIEDVSNNPELLKKLLTVLQDGEDFDCPICISPPTDIVITSCAHIFCQTCIQRTLECNKSRCPLCRRTLLQSDMFLAPQESYDTDNTVKFSSRTMASSKTTALINLLLASRDQNPSAKSIVFSQLKKMLTLLEEPLKAAGFKILCLDGSVTAKRRARVIEEFEVSELNGPTILLTSLKASCTGINLTAASQIYLFEPWWNPAIEEQAINSLHRIGQKQDVKIVRLIVRKSIEERVLYLQEKKKMEGEAFGGRGRNELSEYDLHALFAMKKEEEGALNWFALIPPFYP